MVVSIGRSSIALRRALGGLDGGENHGRVDEHGDGSVCPIDPLLLGFDSIRFSNMRLPPWGGIVSTSYSQDSYSSPNDNSMTG